MPQRLVLATVGIAFVFLVLVWLLLVVRPIEHTAPQYTATVIDPNYEGAMITPQGGPILAWGSDGTIQTSQDGKVWQTSATPTANDLLDMAHNPDGSRLMAVGTQGTVLTSIDAGATWQAIRTLETTATFTSVLFDPSTQTWLAAGHNGTIAIADAAHPTEWQVMPTPFGDHILALTRTPESGHLLLGGEQGLIAQSDNGGRTWEIAPRLTQQPIMAFHHVPDLTLGLSASGQLLTTRNDGQTWQLLDTAQRAHFNDVVFSPQHHTICISASNGTVLYSEDYGYNWRITPLPVDPYASYLDPFILDAKTGSILLFGNRGMLFTSTDGGRNWGKSEQRHKEDHHVILQHPKNRNIISLGNRGYKAVSQDLGQSWEVLQPSLDFYWRDALATPEPALLMVGELGKVILSKDHGQSWQYVPVEYPNAKTPPSYHALRINPNTQTVFATGPTGLIMRSDDLGHRWTVSHYTPFEQGEVFPDLEFDHTGNTGFALEAFNGPYYTVDGGERWQQSLISDKRQLWHSSLLSTAEHRVGLAVGQQGILAVSHDGGITWKVVEDSVIGDQHLYGSYADPSKNLLFALGDGGRILRSKDLGQTWASLNTLTSASIRHMIREPKRQALLAAGVNGLILRSTDDGDHWRNIQTPTHAEIRHFFVEPETNNLLAIGRKGTVLRSEDSGLHWDTLPSGTFKHFRNALWDSQTRDFIVFGERIVRFKSVM